MIEPAYWLTNTESSFVFLGLLTARSPITNVSISPQCNHRYVDQKAYLKEKGGKGSSISDAVMSEGVQFQHSSIQAVFYEINPSEINAANPELFSLSKVEYKEDSSSPKLCVIHTTDRANWLSQANFERLAKIFKYPIRQGSQPNVYDLPGLCDHFKTLQLHDHKSISGFMEYMGFTQIQINKILNNGMGNVDKFFDEMDNLLKFIHFLTPVRSMWPEGGHRMDGGNRRLFGFQFGQTVPLTNNFHALKLPLRSTLHKKIELQVLQPVLINTSMTDLDLEKLRIYSRAILRARELNIADSWPKWIASFVDYVQSFDRVSVSMEQILKTTPKDEAPYDDYITQLNWILNMMINYMTENSPSREKLAKKDITDVRSFFNAAESGNNPYLLAQYKAEWWPNSDQFPKEGIGTNVKSRAIGPAYELGVLIAFYLPVMTTHKGFQIVRKYLRLTGNDPTRHNMSRTIDTTSPQYIIQSLILPASKVARSMVDILQQCEKFSPGRKERRPIHKMIHFYRIWAMEQMLTVMADHGADPSFIEKDQIYIKALIDHKGYGSAMFDKKKENEVASRYCISLMQAVCWTWYEMFDKYLAILKNKPAKPDTRKSPTKINKGTTTTNHIWSETEIYKGDPGYWDNNLKPFDMNTDIIENRWIGLDKDGKEFVNVMKAGRNGILKQARNGESALEDATIALPPINWHLTYAMPMIINSSMIWKTDSLLNIHLQQHSVTTPDTTFARKRKRQISPNDAKYKLAQWSGLSVVSVPAGWLPSL